MRQDLEWTEKIYARDGVVRFEDCAPFTFHLDRNRVIDLQLAKFIPVSKDRLLARRQQMFDVTSAAFRAKCAILTAGLIESWRDTKTGLDVHSAEARGLDPDRFVLEVQDFDKCVTDLSAAIAAIRRQNPSCKFIVTTSPVPLKKTFTGQDVIIANMQSKSVLRAACGIVADRGLADYFPSYEAAMLSAPDNVWQSDQRHVTNEFVERIVDHLLRVYCPADARDSMDLVATKAEHAFADRNQLPVSERPSSVLAMRG